MRICLFAFAIVAMLAAPAWADEDLLDGKAHPTAPVPAPADTDLDAPAVVINKPSAMALADPHATLVSAYQGSAISQYQLALMLLNGKGMTHDPGLAVTWLNCASNQGITEAQFQLAQLEIANQAPGGKTAAYKWLLLSEGKNPDRIALRKKIEYDMKPELVTIIGKQASMWRPTVTPMTEYVKGKRPACFDQK